MTSVAQLETNMEELLAAFGSRETPAADSRESLIFGIYDRLIDQGNCVSNVVLVPADESGEPDYDRAGPANVESLPADEWPQDESAAKRAAVIVDHLAGCHEDSSFLVIIKEDGEPAILHIHGPDADRDIAHAIIARDIGAAPVVRRPSKLAESLAKLTEELFSPKSAPVAANDNKPQIDKRLIAFGDAYGGQITGNTLFSATVDGARGQIAFSADGNAWFHTAKGSRRLGLPEKPKDRFTVDWFGDLDEDMPKETIVKGVFGVNEFTMLSGKPGSGKSVITTDLACHVAAGMEWHGRRVKQGLVVYVAAERRDLTKRRMMAFRKHHGVGTIPLAVVGGRMDLTSTVADAEALAASIRQLEEDCGHKCVWIVIDTLTRVFGPGDQNASKDMSRFVLSCDALREAVPGSHVTVIHHTGWNGDRGKGAIDLDGAVDASFLVKKEGRGYLLECDGTNDGEEGAITRFTMEGVQVGVDEDGEPTIAPVVVPGAIEKPAERLLNGPARKALDALIELSGDGEPVPMALWRAKCRELFDDGKSTQDALNKKFDRAKEALVKDGKVELVDGGFLPI